MSRCSNCGKTISGKGSTDLCARCFLISYNKSRESSWSKGLTKETDDRILKMGKTISKVLKGNKKVSKAMKNVWKNDPNRKLRTANRLKKWIKDNKELHIESARRGGVRVTSDSVKMKSLLKSQRRKPTKPELKLSQILNDFDNWRYVGDNKIFIGTKNPDFIDEESKKVIELFGDYWHQGESTDDRIKYFKNRGFDTLVVWEHELNNKSLLSRIKNFVLQ